MLLSPGHSPRHLSLTPASSSPSPDQTLDSTPPAAASGNPRKRRPAVLDEDTYVAAIERIIERDFFPDIPKLRDRLDWLEATRTGDPVLIRDAQLKILERRAAAGKTPSVLPDATGTGQSSRTRTPGSAFFPSSSATPFGSEKIPFVPDRPLASDDPSADVDSSLSLDKFFRRYTSEDNESFSKILEKVNRKRRERFAHLLVGEREGPVKALEDEKRDRITDGFGTSDQPLSSLDGWKYTAKNLLMYIPAEEVPLTVEERAERINGMTKEINRCNTRFHSKLLADSRTTKEEEAIEILYTPVPGTTPAGAAWPFADREAEQSRKYDLEDLKKTPNPFYTESAKKSENGYSFVKTPSPAPGVDESPFMTWGEIEGTPLRLEFEDTPVDIGGSSEGPRFRIPYPPSRDVKAHSLSREAARKLRERSKLFRKPPLLSPSRGGSVSPSMRTLSPAAQKLVRNAIAKSSHGVDETLRASYRGASPLTGTPKERRSLTRFSRDGSLRSMPPSVRQDSTPPW